MNASNLCRLCLRKDSILESILPDNGDNLISKAVIEVLNIKVKVLAPTTSNILHRNYFFIPRFVEMMASHGSPVLGVRTS